MTEFLSAGGLDISLITFHAFDLNGQTLIARQTEITSQQQKIAKQQRVTKESNTEALRERLRTTGIEQLFDSVTQVVRADLSELAYEWPNVSTYAFNLPERAASGNPSYRVYVSLVVNAKKKGQLGIAFLERAARLLPKELEAAQKELTFEEYWSGNVTYVSAETWQTKQAPIRQLLVTLVTRWKAESQVQDDGETDTQEV